MTDKTTQPREQADEQVPGIDYPTTYADLARISPLQLWNRWYPRNSSISARDAFIAARSLPFVAPVAAPEAPTLQTRWKRSSAEDLQRDGYEWDREWLESLAAQVNRRGLHVSTSAVEALVCLLASTGAAPLVPEVAASEQQAEGGISPTYAWLTRSARSGIPEVDNAARTMMAYYQGAEFPEATTASASGEACPICTEGRLLQAHVCNKCETVVGTAEDARANVRATAPSRNAAPLDEDVIWETYGKTHSRTSKNCGHYIMYHRGFQDGAALTQQSAAQTDWKARAERAEELAKQFARDGDELCKKLDAAQASHAGADTERVAAYVPGQWFDARTLDEMQAFYLSRLPAIREAAQEHGYAIGLHGSERRDFDLMAMQWRADASPKDTLAHAIAVAACGITREGTYAWESKPSGRFAVSIPICWTDHGNPEFGDKPSLGHIDLSVIDPSWMILFIEKRAEDYARENASSEHDTGATVWHYGGAARDYHNTLVELADDLRAAMSAATEQKEKP